MNLIKQGFSFIISSMFKAIEFKGNIPDGYLKKVISKKEAKSSMVGSFYIAK